LLQPLNTDLTPQLNYFLGRYKLLRTSSEIELEVKCERKDIIETFERMVSEIEDNKNFYVVPPSSEFINELISLEELNPQKIFNMKMGIIYCRNGQESPQQILKNGLNGDVVCPYFWDFVSLMGEQINLEEWTACYIQRMSYCYRKNLLDTHPLEITPKMMWDENTF